MLENEAFLKAYLALHSCEIPISLLADIDCLLIPPFFHRSISLLYKQESEWMCFEDIRSVKG